MKLLRFFFLALFAGIASQASAQVNLDDLAQAIGEAPENTAVLVQEAVTESPTQVEAILSRLLGEYPEHAEEIILGVVSGLPKPLSEEDLSAVVSFAIQFSPGLAAEIVRGARRATNGSDELQAVIIDTARGVLQGISLGQLGGINADPTEETVYEDSLRISPAS